MSRRRAIVTLLHGNEPSGLRAVHQLLREGIKPATHLGILVAAVDAARHPPVFSHRFIPGERDLNRCFAPPYNDPQGQLAANIIALLETFSPEIVIDTHNTSSHSQPFCVTVENSKPVRAIASLFADHLIVINQPLGTLLEYAPAGMPVVTAEFGGFMDPRADELALMTVREFVTADQLPSSPLQPLSVLEHSLRLETGLDLPVAYGSTLIEEASLTMINTIDQLNFRCVPAGHTLGWFTQLDHGHLCVINEEGEDVFEQFFSQDDGLLRTRQEMTLFMATTDPVVANTDCLLYFNPTP